MFWKWLWRWNGCNPFSVCVCARACSAVEKWNGVYTSEEGGVKWEWVGREVGGRWKTWGARWLKFGGLGWRPKRLEKKAKRSTPWLGEMAATRERSPTQYTPTLFCGNKVESGGCCGNHNSKKWGPFLSFWISHVLSLPPAGPPPSGLSTSNPNIPYP